MNTRAATPLVRTGTTTSADTPVKFNWLQSQLVRATAVLVALTALGNAGLDLYAVVTKQARTTAEATNLTLSGKYLHTNPASIVTVPIRTVAGTSDATFYIYDEGDINVEYAGRTQWFGLNNRPEPSSRLGAMFMPSAQAQALAPAASAPAAPPRILRQTSAMADGQVLRSQLYSDGWVQETRIDPRSGAILEQSRRKASVEEMKVRPVQYQQYRAVDLRR